MVVNISSSRTIHSISSLITHLTLTLIKVMVILPVITIRIITERTILFTHRRYRFAISSHSSPTTIFTVSCYFNSSLLLIHSLFIETRISFLHLGYQQQQQQQQQLQPAASSEGFSWKKLSKSLVQSLHEFLKSEFSDEEVYTYRHITCDALFLQII